MSEKEQSGPIAVQYRDQIIQRVANGEMLADIAKDLGIKPPNVSKHLAKDEEYRLARENGAEVRLERSRKALEEVAELGVDEDGRIVGITQQQGNLARVRAERLKADMWFAEREFPHRWGQKQEVNHSISIVKALESISVIEGECTPVTHEPITDQSQPDHK